MGVNMAPSRMVSIAAILALWTVATAALTQESQSQSLLRESESVRTLSKNTTDDNTLEYVPPKIKDEDDDYSSSSEDDDDSTGNDEIGWKKLLPKPLVKPKPQPKAHPTSKTPRSKPLPKSHPRSKSPKMKPLPKPKPHLGFGDFGGKWGGSDGGSNGGWGGKWGDKWGVKDNSTSAAPSMAPIASCSCKVFSDESCAFCFEGTGECPDKECAEDCCQVKECFCDEYDNSICKACLANGKGKCPDVDCANACCEQYDSDGSSFQPKSASGYTVGNMHYWAKSSMSINGNRQYFTFSILLVVVGSAIAAIAFSSGHSGSEYEGDEPLAGVREMDVEGTDSRNGRKGRKKQKKLRGVREHEIEILDSFELSSRRYVHPTIEGSSTSQTGRGMDVPEIKESSVICEQGTEDGGIQPEPVLGGDHSGAERIIT